MTNTEQQVEDLIKRGEIDRVIEIYQSLKPYSSRTLNMIGTLYGENKGDYELAVYYLQQALEIQEQVHRQITQSNKLKTNSFFFSL